MFAKGIKALNVEVRVIVAGSEGETSRNMVEAHGFEYIEVANSPLSNKMNAASLAAKGSDYVICLGSDDVIHPLLMQQYLIWMNQGYDFIGSTDYYFYDLTTKSAAYWGGYIQRGRRGETVGAGRIFSQRLMNRCGWKLWADGLDKGLDSTSKLNIRGKVKKFRLAQLGLYAIDLKSEENITKFEMWPNTSYIDAKLIETKFSHIFE
jgi:glycosyltransferase involved in cell wall biosynthesis